MIICTEKMYWSMLHGVGRAVFGLHIPDVSASSGESGSGVIPISIFVMITISYVYKLNIIIALSR